MKCTYCQKAIEERRLALVEWGVGDEIGTFCDRHCLYGWAFMTAVDEAMERKASGSMSPGELRRRANHYVTMEEFERQAEEAGE